MDRDDIVACLPLLLAIVLTVAINLAGLALAAWVVATVLRWMGVL